MDCAKGIVISRALLRPKLAGEAKCTDLRGFKWEIFVLFSESGDEERQP